MLARLDVALQPVEVLGLGLRTGDDEEERLRQACHREIGLDAAALIEPLCVHHLAGCDVDVVRAYAVEYLERIGSLEAKLGERGLIEEADGVAHGAVLVRARLEPVLPSVAVLISGDNACGRVPVRALPAERLAETGARLREALVQGRAPHAARGLVLAERPVRCVQKTQTLAHPRLQVLAVHLKRHIAPHVHFPQIDRRMAVTDPFGHDLADAARGLQTDGIQARSDEAVLELGRFAQVIAHVRCEALRAAKEFLDAGALERRHAAHGVHEDRLEVGKIAVDLAEREIFGNAVRAPWTRVAARTRPTRSLPASYLK